jgi:hypothetical protein
MNEHLKLVREFHEAFAFPQAEQGANRRLSEMDIVKYQALLMAAGSEVLNGIKAGEMVDLLLGLVDLAYAASAAIAKQGGDIIDGPVSWRQDGSVLSIMKMVSEKINQCAAGDSAGYSAVYCLCSHLVRGFVNADFDKAFRIVHNNHVSQLQAGGQSIYDTAAKIRKLKLQKTPDLSDCLYE